MDSALIGLIAAIVALVVLNLAALRFGADTRPSYPDRQDWR